jgi:hypothetical protein
LEEGSKPAAPDRLRKEIVRELSTSFGERCNGERDSDAALSEDSEQRDDKPSIAAFGARVLATNRVAAHADAFSSDPGVPFGANSFATP